MAKVICIISGCPTKVNGFTFTSLGQGQMVSEELTDAQAEYFASIPGYKLVTAPPSKVSAATQATAAAASKT